MEVLPVCPVSVSYRCILHKYSNNGSTIKREFLIFFVIIITGIVGLLTRLLIGLMTGYCFILLTVETDTSQDILSVVLSEYIAMVMVF